MSMTENAKITLASGEALAARRCVKLSGATLVYTDAGEECIGVTEYAVGSGVNVTIRTITDHGTFEFTAAGAISASAAFYPADDGKVSANANGEALGRALEAATADGDLIEGIPVKGSAGVLADSARSRAATAMPTAAIWNNFDLSEMRKNPFAGSLLESDFTHGEDVPSEKFTDASSVIRVLPGAAGEGVISLFITADNEEAAVQFQSCPITSSGGVAWGLEARIKASTITDTKAGFFFGLMAGEAALAGDLIADAGTLADVGAIGFQNKEGDGDIIDLVYDKASQTQNEHDDDYHTLVADTYVTLGLYFNGTTIQGYLNGVLTGTAISGADIAAADFPAADVLVPTLVIKGAAADDKTITIDWIRAAQLAA
jgi:hypothetical protein